MDENNDFEDSNYVMKGESSVSEDNWSGYESNDNDEGFITHSEEEHLVAKLAKGIRGIFMNHLEMVRLSFKLDKYLMICTILGE